MNNQIISNYQYSGFTKTSVVPPEISIFVNSDISLPQKNARAHLKNHKFLKQA